MSETPVELHKKFIQGVNLRMIGCMAVFLLSLGYYANKFQNMLEEDHANILSLTNQFIELKTTVDTIKSRQENNTIINTYEFKDLHRQLDSKSTNVTPRKTGSSLYTERYIAGKLTFNPDN